jgi:hypothetical protein
LCLVVVATAYGEERILELGRGERLRYEVLEPGDPARRSARDTAMQVLRHLAAGGIEDAAALSNVPQRRFEVLRDYRASVGDDEFKRVFAQYLQKSIVAEIAIGPRRLIIWDLAGASNQLAGQFYVEVEGRFLMDDVPSDARSDLRRVLQSYRKAATPSKQRD